MADEGEHTLKLLVDNTTKRVLFAEAGKEAVDFLFGLLSMPMASIVSLLTKERMVGCIGNVYKSVEAMDDAYLYPTAQVKTTLLKPAGASPSVQATFLLAEPSTPSKAKAYYKCNQNFHGGGCHTYVTDGSGARCPSCNGSMTTKLNYVAPDTGKVVAAPAAGEGGYVKGVVTYTVMDDLTVTPMSTISSIAMLNKCRVKDVSALEERTVKLGFDQGLELLNVSLQSNSKTVLTDVFLKQ